MEYEDICHGYFKVKQALR